MGIRLAVCDDEKPIRDELIRWIREHVSDAMIHDFFVWRRFAGFAGYIRYHFLDIEMKGEANGGDRIEELFGMDTAKHLRCRSEGAIDGVPILIFVTGDSD